MITIREAALPDAAAIASIHVHSWRSAYQGLLSDQYLQRDAGAERLRYWQQRLAEPSQDALAVHLANHGDLAVGFACVLLEDDTRTALLDNVHVLPEWQGRGIGRQLLAAVADWVLGNLPDALLYLWVFEANTAARRFYRLLGAVEVGSKELATLDGRQVIAVRCQWESIGALKRRLGSSQSQSPETPPG